MSRNEALQSTLRMFEDGNFPGDLTGPEMGFPDTSAATIYDAFSGSFDAAIRLLKTVLPGWTFSIVPNFRTGKMVVRVFLPGVAGETASHADPARALIMAIIKALIAQE